MRRVSRMAAAGKLVLVYFAVTTCCGVYDAFQISDAVPSFVSCIAFAEERSAQAKAIISKAISNASDGMELDLKS